MKRRAFLKQLSVLFATPVMLPALLRAPAAANVIDGEVADVVEYKTFTNCHFRTPIRAHVVHGCVFKDCTYETSIVEVHWGEPVQYCVFDNCKSLDGRSDCIVQVDGRREVTR